MEAIMTKPASTPILAVISTLPVIVACALVGATQARAAMCTMSPSTCNPYVVTIDQVGNNVVATGTGEFDLAGLNPDMTINFSEAGEFGLMLVVGL
jgi:type IV secretory pathway TrbF-like protein